jgi:hypothetical protein
MPNNRIPLDTAEYRRWANAISNLCDEIDRLREAQGGTFEDGVEESAKCLIEMAMNLTRAYASQSPAMREMGRIRSEALFEAAKALRERPDPAPAAPTKLDILVDDVPAKGEGE